jgi:hypothetical protein
MKATWITALEPLLLLRAHTLAQELPAGRRAEVQRLAEAAAKRSTLAGEAREPGVLPAACCLAREALALSVSALLVARGKLELGDGALSAPAAWAALQALARDDKLALPSNPELAALMTGEDPARVDALDSAEQRRLQSELEALLDAVRRSYEPRTARRVALLRYVQLAAAVLLLSATVLAFVIVFSKP